MPSRFILPDNTQEFHPRISSLEFREIVLTWGFSAWRDLGGRLRRGCWWQSQCASGCPLGPRSWAHSQSACQLCKIKRSEYADPPLCWPAGSGNGIACSLLVEAFVLWCVLLQFSAERRHLRQSKSLAQKLRCQIQPCRKMTHSCLVLEDHSGYSYYTTDAYRAIWICL